MSIVIWTGTNTEVGKSFTAAAMARALTMSGKKVIAIKPVESGCDGTRLEDGVLLAQATGQDEPAQALVRLVKPVAPPVAAEEEGVDLHISSWVRTIRQAEADVVFVEGAGGLLSPITWDRTILDLAVTLSASVVVVCANELGTLNHTCLTLDVLSRRHVNVLGVLMNHPVAERSDDASVESNVASLKRLVDDLPVLGLPHVSSWEQLVDHVRPALDWFDTE